MKSDPPAGGSDHGGRWRRHREEASLPRSRVVLGVAILAVLAGGWWILADWTVGGTAGHGAESASAGAAAGPTAGSAEALSHSPAGEPLPYSVLLSSHPSREEAAARVRRLRSRDAGLHYVTPVPSADDPVSSADDPVSSAGGLEWRVYAAGRSDPPTAGDRAAAGGKTAARGSRGDGGEAAGGPREIRVTPFAFFLGRRPSLELALRARDALGEDAIFAYVLPEGDSARRSFLLYAGAFEERRASEFLGERLREAGHRAELMIRRGEPR